MGGRWVRLLVNSAKPRHKAIGLQGATSVRSGKLPADRPLRASIEGRKRKLNSSHANLTLQRCFIASAVSSFDSSSNLKLAAQFGQRRSIRRRLFMFTNPWGYAASRSHYNGEHYRWSIRSGRKRSLKRHQHCPMSPSKAGDEVPLGILTCESR